MAHVRARVTVSPSPYTETRQLQLLTREHFAQLEDDPSELIEFLTEQGLHHGSDEVAVRLGSLHPGSRWRKCLGSYHYVVADMGRVWTHTSAPDLVVFSVSLGGHSLNDESPDLIVATTIDQLPNWDHVGREIAYMTEDK